MHSNAPRARSPAGNPSRRAPAASAPPVDRAPTLDAERAKWEAERETLLQMLGHQQRVAQAGLITSSLAHDVRNQAQLILSTAELALHSGDAEEMRSALDGIRDLCRDVAETTDAFLAFARRQSALDDQRFLLSEVLAHGARIVRPLAHAHSVAFRADVAEDGGVRGECRLAVQAVVNLATNAVKACGERPGAEVTLSASCPRAGICRLTVADNGPGIPETMRARLFRPFSGVHTRGGGNGLGLFIVRQAVLDLGGTIAVRTSPLGTVFRVDLPAAAPSDA